MNVVKAVVKFLVQGVAVVLRILAKGAELVASGCDKISDSLSDSSSPPPAV